MTKRDVLRRAEAAIVGLPELGGRGVLVPGGFVLTAMHCIGWDGSAGWVLGDHHPVRVNAGDREFRLGPWYADAVSDMAALGPLDNQEFPDDEDAFDEWRGITPAVRLSPWLPKPRTARRHEPTPLPVNLFSLKREWFPGEVVYWGSELSTGTICVTGDQPIKGGMSGGPIVDDRGRLVGVVSWGSGEGAIPLARMALPGWIMGRIEGRSGHAQNTHNRAGSRRSRQR